MNKYADYMITEHGIKPLTCYESEFWLFLKENDGIVTYDEVLQRYFGKHELEYNKKRCLNTLQVIAQSINDKVGVTIIDSYMTKFFKLRG